MSNVNLIINGPSGTEEARLNPKGSILGRGDNCDVILDGNGVSRQHARIYQDPFGRWIIEDLNSRNGVYVEGQPVRAHAISPNQEISITPFILTLTDEFTQTSKMSTSAMSKIPMVDKGLEENIVSYRADRSTILSPDLVQHLNEFTSHLLKLPSPSELYKEACLSLARILDTLVAIVRLPDASQNITEEPDMLACYFGRDSIDTQIDALQTSEVNLSKRVLDAVRKTDCPVMAMSGPSDKNMVLTVVDKSNPHIVFCARVNNTGEAVDALYVDILEKKSPDGMFDFVEAVGRQINLAQKTLFFVELEKKEKALREANAQLKEKDRIKDEYVSRVTHDIKGHLAAIQSCLHIACDESTGPLNEKQTDFLGRSRRRTAQLTDFVKELLELTRMRLSGKFETAPFSFPDCMTKALAECERKAEDKSITLTSKIEPAIKDMVGNRFSINEMISNLTLNAIKYTPDNKSVHVEATDLDDKIQIDIIDTGIGIPADDVDKVFEEFFRAKNAKSEKDGSGLGLSIVKQIVDSHGGTISVKSTEGQGTTFTVILPKGN
jgi:signal transduction histidine kinase